MAAKLATFRPGLGVATLAKMAAPAPGAVYTGDELLAAQLKCLASGQLLFDSSRVVGETGIVVPMEPLGSAREAAIKAVKSGDERQRGYGLVTLATIAAVRISHAHARPAVLPIGVSPLAVAGVVVGVVGIAAVVAGSYYAKEAYTEAIHVDAQIVKSLAAADAVGTIGSAAVAAGQPIPKEVTDALRDLASTEIREDSWWPSIAVGAVGVAAGLALEKFLSRGGRR